MKADEGGDGCTEENAEGLEDPCSEENADEGERMGVNAEREGAGAADSLEVLSTGGMAWTGNQKKKKKV